MIEVWKDIKGYEGLYQVSNLGRVKSLEKLVPHFKGGLRKIKERVLKNNKGKQGYSIVVLCNEKGHKTFKVHKLVAIEFLNHKPDGWNLVVDHINNDKDDNRACNLQVITQRKNVSKEKKGFSSEYIGVCWHKSTKKWTAQIGVGKERKYLGLFDCELEASKAYQKALKEIL